MQDFLKLYASSEILIALDKVLSDDVSDRERCSGGDDTVEDGLDLVLGQIEVQLVSAVDKADRFLEDLLPTGLEQVHYGSSVAGAETPNEKGWNGVKNVRDASWLIETEIKLKHNIKRACLHTCVVIPSGSRT